MTEVPLNPGFDISMNIRDIEDHIVTEFEIDLRDLTCFRIMPRGYPDRIAPMVFTKRGQTSRTVLAIAIGHQLPSLPEDQALRSLVMDLGGAEIKSIRRQVFEAIPVTDLPSPYNPFRCMYRDRFDSSQQAAGQAFLESLTADEVRACWYHMADWAAIADESVRIVDKVGRLKPEGQYLREARQSNLSDGDQSWDSDLRWLISLFEQPIIIAGGGYTDGQHRACALRFSGAPRAVVVVGNEDVATRKNDWHYLGEG